VLRINTGSRPAVAPLDHAELRRLLACGGLHLVAVADDRAVVGYALTFGSADQYDGEEFRYFTAQLDRPWLYIDQIAADRDRQRAGIGRTLYEALMAHARANGIAALCCEVNTSPPNPASLAFHRQLGFEPIGDETVIDGRTVAFLVCEL
jgi:uncharacterized protein